MNDEIKEILDRLDFEEWEVDLYKVPITWCELYDIRDYITNLQKENQKLKEDKIKAIEHIEEIWKSAEGGNIYVITIVGLIRADLLNILQNGSGEE